MKSSRIARKVGVQDMLEILTNLYESGVDYVDISGTLGKDTDSITFTFTTEYLSDEAKENFKEKEETKNLTIDDINKLI